MGLAKGVVAGIITSVCGVTLAIAGVAAGIPDIKEIINEVQSENITDSCQIQGGSYVLDLSAASVIIEKSEKKESYIEYGLSSYSSVEVTDSSFKISTDYPFGFIFNFTKNNIFYNTVHVYIAEDSLESLDITLDFGKLTIEKDINIGSFSYEQNAGTATIKGMVSKSADIHMNAGNIDIIDSKIKDLKIEVNAGNVNASILNPMKFYTIHSDINAGSLNISPKNTHSQVGSELGYNLDIEVNAGNASITFKEEA